MKDNLSNIPAELQELHQWVVWKADKHPRNALTGANASTSDPSTWSSFQVAQDQVRKGRFSGVGFVFTENDPYMGIDLDKVIDNNGDIDYEAQAIIDKMDSYTEISQGVHGIHIIVRGRKPSSKCRKGNVEIYDKGRYFALTGNLWQDRGVVNDRQEALNWLCEEAFGESEPQATPVDVDDLVFDPDADPPENKLDALLDDDDFRKTWEHIEGEWGSLSDYDWHLAGFAFRAGWSDQEIANLIIAFRREHGTDSDWKKSLRKDYIPRTIAKLKEGRKSISYVPLALRSMDEIEVKEVEWLWYPYIPLGKLILFEGDPGEGKSWVSLAIATRITLEDLGGPANILIASAEDDFDDTIRPRLEELGANLGLIYAIEETFTLGSKKGLNDNAFEMLEKHLREKEPSLVIIDPLTAYLGSGVDMHRQNETRPVMARLASLAREYNCAMLLIRHINKGGSTKAIYRGMGSIDFTASARSVLLAGHVDHEDGSMERALVHIKSNLAPLGAPIGYILGHPFQWTDSTLTANEILNQPDGGGKKTDEAVVLIRALLADGEAVPANEIFAAAKEAGISERTMKDAKKMLKVKSGSKGKGKDRWHWYLPKGKEQPSVLEPIVKDGRISINLDDI